MASKGFLEGMRMTDRTPITLTAKAIANAKSLWPDDGGKDTVLRLYLEGKGCDGFIYGVCFDDKAPDDLVFGTAEVPLVVDETTYPFVAGSVIHWLKEKERSGFVVDNPNHKKFRGKFFKRKNWQGRLLPEGEIPPALQPSPA